jgi:hypothetical protein
MRETASPDQKKLKKPQCGTRVPTDDRENHPVLHFGQEAPRSCRNPVNEAGNGAEENPQHQQRPVEGRI